MAVKKAKPATFLLVGSRENPVRFSYANTDTPRAVEEGGALKYSVAAVWPKTNKALTEKVKAKIAIAMEEGKDTLKGKNQKSPKFKYPLYDGDEEKPGDPVYAGCMYINASSSEKPQIVDESGEELLNPKQDFYSGCYGRVSVNFYAFNKSGGVGVGCGLSNLQKFKDGPKLSSRTSAADDFGDDDDEYEYDASTSNSDDDDDDLV